MSAKSETLLKLFSKRITNRVGRGSFLDKVFVLEVLRERVMFVGRGMSKVTNLITSLGDGGAEATLVKLVSHPGPTVHSVLALMAGGKYFQRLVRQGIIVETLRMKRGVLKVSDFLSLVRYLRKSRSELVMTWLHHSDLLSVFWSLLPRSPHVIWNVRVEPLEWRQHPKLRLILLILAVASHFVPRQIVYCSESARSAHQRIGYTRKLGVVVNNGYDFPRIDHRRLESATNRANEDIPTTFGTLGRYAHQKDYGTLFSALAELKLQGHSFSLEMAGNGMSYENLELVALLDAHGISDKTKLLGQVPSFASVFPRWDIYVSSSTNEGFQNSLAEAAGFGLICVSTDVGAAREILGGTEFLVPARSHRRLAEKLKEAMKMTGDERRQVSLDQQNHVRREFSSERMLANYERVIAEVRERLPKRTTPD